ncbi:hypothetical protein KFZ56_17920 [Virgibacillus sp. NKC19-3]|uniref:hypothetical protein n=1 Tax=Virgibacillus saliphilus TaxID=2831674 RepID=UPI001C9B291F|nr:hypothetical protein [Virgibacillus sp. NKC19-3]MBY7144897.1 hypothetical protein [Virgibacillus sp. NKC19-3]
MQLYSIFDNDIFLEMAISTLEKRGIKRESIYAVPLDNRVEARRLFDSLDTSDGTSLIDIGTALATAFAVVGTSIGFKMAWGPIVWGLLFAFLGFIIGVVIRLFTENVFKKRKRMLKGKHPEVILIIDCKEEWMELVEKILWEHLALGVAKVK